MKLLLITLVALVVGVTVACGSDTRTSDSKPAYSLPKLSATDPPHTSVPEATKSQPTTAPPSTKPQPTPPTSLSAPILTESLARGLVNSYVNSGRNIALEEGKRRALGSERRANQYAHIWGTATPVPNPFPHWNCLSVWERGGSEPLSYKAGYWEFLISGGGCEGVEIFHIEDSYDGVITRIRP